MNMIEERYCSLISAAAAEPQVGTAAEQTVWLLLEYDAPWRRKAVTDNDLPEPVQQWLAETIAAIPGSRLIFIRSESGRMVEGIHFYIIDTDDAATQQYRFLLERYDDLLTMDVTAVLSGQTAAAAWERPIYTICTNGKRDFCCAKFGLPIYKKLATQWPDQVWQCTHIGGHRYSGTMMAFPAGICYGRLDPESAVTVVTAHEAGTVSLPYLRGRSRYNGAAQAAEFYLRERTGRYSLTDFLHIDTSQPADNEWLVTFGDRQENTLHDIWLKRGLHDQPILKSCREENMINVSAFQLTAWETIHPREIGIE